MTDGFSMEWRVRKSNSIISQYCKNLMDVLAPSSGFEIRSLCLTGHFWCWRKSHCSSPIPTKGFGGAVNLLFDPAFTGNFPYFSYKVVPDLQKINLFKLILINIFLRKYIHSLPFCLQHSWNPKKNKVYIFAKPAFQEATQCHHLVTLYEIWFFWFDVK